MKVTDSKNLLKQLKQVKGSDVTLQIYDLLERIDCPWIRLARDESGQLKRDSKTKQPLLANEPPSMAEITKTIIILLDRGNPRMLQAIASGRLDNEAHRLLQVISPEEISTFGSEINRILLNERG